MRAASVIGRVFLIATLGVLTTSDESQGQEKKAQLEDPYNEYVTIRRYVGQKDLEFAQPQEDVHAMRSTDKDGKSQFTVKARGNGSFTGGAPPVRSEIIGASGTVWVVTKRIGTGSDPYHLEVVEKKPAK